MKTLKNITLVLSTGYIFVYFSEHLFWARPRPHDSLAGWLGAWAAYSLAAFVFLWLVTSFRIGNPWALFLAGAAFGWLTEGVIVQTAYESLPLSLSFTGLAWHALLTVWVGWYALRQALHSPGYRSTLKLAGLVGLGYGLWAVSWWGEPDGGVASMAEFAAYSLVTTLLVVLAYRLADWSSTAPFMPDRRITAAVAGAFLLYFIFVTIPATPVAMVILPILLGLVYWGLRQNCRSSAQSTFLESLAGDVPAFRYLSLLALPAAAVLVYAAATFFEVRWQTNWILYLATTPLGFILFGVSLYRLWREQRQKEPDAG